MKKIRLHYLVGDVHLGGHDVHRVARGLQTLLKNAGCFEVLTVCDEPSLGDLGYDAYFLGERLFACDAVIFNCGDYRFNTPQEQRLLEAAVAGGKGFVLLHGDHPCYWPQTGTAPWAEFEKMAGMVWRDDTSHGDFAAAHVAIADPNHPITAGLTDFDTKDEIFCGLNNPHGVACHALAQAYSDPRVISRHGRPGTGRWEPVAMIGQYGRGRTYNQTLGHVWPYYTGHGLHENTMISFQPLQMRIMLVRACEWAATGQVTQTKNFSGKARLF